MYVCIHINSPNPVAPWNRIHFFLDMSTPAYMYLYVHAGGAGPSNPTRIVHGPPWVAAIYMYPYL